MDLDDDVELIRAIHRRFVAAGGNLVLTAIPASRVDDLVRTMLIALDVLWRLPSKLRPGGVTLAGESRAIAEWEISWALTRVGITSLWVLDADRANLCAWRWLRDTAERENLRLILHTTTVPSPLQAAALSGCRVRTLSPEQLQNPRSFCPGRSHAGTDTRSPG